MSTLWNKLLNGFIFNTFINPVSYYQSSIIQRNFCDVVLKLRNEFIKKQAKPKPPRTHPINGAPFAKAIILKCVIKKPRKPNSANRKCALVKLKNGKEKVAFIPGIGHNLQEHQVVLLKAKRLKDTPGVKLTCVRGKYDLPHIKKVEA